MVGIEAVRVRRHLGYPELEAAVLEEEIEKKIQKQKGTMYQLRRRFMPNAYLSREIKLEKLRGRLAEIKRGRDRATDAVQEDTTVCAVPQVETGDVRD